jgi:CelD/BcsL family acetyltransferase involved in cellulose biosynthesis
MAGKAARADIPFSVERTQSHRSSDAARGSSTPPADARTISVARSVSEVEALRPAWEELSGNVVATDPDWCTGVLDVLPGGGRPHVVALEHGAHVGAIVVGNLRKRPVPCKIGRKAVYSPEVATISIVEDGFLGRIDADNATVLVRELLAALDRREAELCLLLHLPASSSVRSVVNAEVGFARRAHGELLEKRWSRPIPDSYDEFLASVSRRMRKGMRQARRRLEQQLGTRLTLRSLRGVDETDELIRDAERVARLTYQWKRGVGFRDTELTRWSVSEAARRGLLRAWVLHLDELPIAFEWGIAYNRTFRWVDGGFDPAHAEHRPGAYLMGKTIEALCEDADVGRIDFGLGDSEYKRWLGCTFELEGNVLLSAARPRGLWVASAYTATNLATQAYRVVR